MVIFYTPINFYGCFEHNLSASEKEHIEKIIDKRGDNDHTKKQVKLLIFNNKHKTNPIDSKTNIN
jgi:hypothetical protein